jgi:hypothetical protein
VHYTRAVSSTAVQILEFENTNAEFGDEGLERIMPLEKNGAMAERRRRWCLCSRVLNVASWRSIGNVE